LANNSKIFVTYARNLTYHIQRILFLPMSLKTRSIFSTQKKMRSRLRESRLMRKSKNRKKKGGSKKRKSAKRMKTTGSSVGQLT